MIPEHSPDNDLTDDNSQGVTDRHAYSRSHEASPAPEVISDEDCEHKGQYHPEYQSGQRRAEHHADKGKKAWELIAFHAQHYT